MLSRLPFPRQKGNINTHTILLFLKPDSWITKWKIFFQNSNHTIYCIAAFSDFGKTSKSPCKYRKIYRGLWHQLHQFVIRLMGNDIGQVPRTGSGRQQPSHSYEFIFASEKIEGHCFRLLKESKRQYSKPAFQRNSHLIWSIVLGKDSVTF